MLRGGLLAALLAAGLRAQGLIAPAAPLAPPPAAVSPADQGATLAAARRAHDLGLLGLAAELYRKLQDMPGADRPAASLALAAVLLDAGLPAEADQALAALPPPHGAAWQLRRGLAALQLRRREAAQAAWDAVRPDDVPSEDRAWYVFLQAALYDTATPRDVTKANELYNRARDLAPTELAKAQFQLAAERVRLTPLKPPGEGELEQARKLHEQFRGRETGYGPARQYAVMLVLAGRRGDAVRFVQQQVLLGMPPAERGWRDEFHFLLGLFGDRTRTGAGRNALLQLLANGSKPERQRQALQLLADASAQEPERGQFRAEIARLLALTPVHPLRETLLYFRAQLALGDKDFATAEEQAGRLLRDYPGSPLRVHAFGLLTQSAWEQRRFRQAAPNARRAREALAEAAAGETTARARADLGVLEAEAWFLAGEFRYAADAYAAVLRDRAADLTGARVSELLFMRVLAEIRAGGAEAVRVLDEVTRDPALLPVDRWQAEWALARAWQVQNRTAEAYARVGRLIAAEPAESAAALPPELRTRMAWLHARLAFESGRAAEALPLADKLLETPAELAPALRAEIASAALLLRANAEFALAREAAALETLGRLRAGHPRSEAAMYSYLIESDYYQQQAKIAEAQVRLTRLTDNEAFKDSPYVPLALFRLALLSEQLGQEKDLEEANKRIEQLVNPPAGAAAPDADLLFAARFKQGDLLRRLTQFPQAQRAYEDLVNRYPQRPDVVLAQLALADCHNAQSSSDPSHADNAQLLYEQLRDRVDAPPEVRVEAGYKLGLLLARRGRKVQAAEAWWRDVVMPFLLEERRSAAGAAARVQDKRPYWLARTLLDLGKLYEEEGRTEEARNAYALVARAGLGVGEKLAREELKRLGVPEGRL